MRLSFSIRGYVIVLMYLPLLPALSAPVLSGNANRRLLAPHVPPVRSIRQVLKALFSLATLTREHRQQDARTASKKDDDAPRSDAARQISRPWRISDLGAPLHEALATRRADFLILLVPSILYSGQNNLLVRGSDALSNQLIECTFADPPLALG